MPEIPAQLPPLDQDAATDGAMEFVLQLARALHVYGTPAHRLEEAMSLSSRMLGIPGQFFSTPTAIFASFSGTRDHGTHLLRIGPGVVDLEKLLLVDAVMNDVIAGTVRPDAGRARLAEIEGAPPRYGLLVRWLAYAALSASAALFFGGGIDEVVFGGIAGLLVGMLAEFVGRSRTSLSIVEPLAAVVASAGSLVWGAFLTPVDVDIATVAALILLVPGFTLTVAMNELATRNLMSGTARLMFGGIVLFGIGFGVALGRQIAPWLPSPLVADAVPAPAVFLLWGEGVALALTGWALTVCFHAPLREVGWIIISCVLAYTGAQVVLHSGQQPEIAAFCGAFLVGAGSSVYARVFDRPSSVTQVPGIMLLVPGSLGLRSVSQIAAKETVPGVDAAFQVVMVGMAIVTGLLVANLVVPPRKIL